MSDSEHSKRYLEENLLTSPEETQPTFNYPEFHAAMRRAMETCDEQARGNNRLAENFLRVILAPNFGGRNSAA